MVRRLDIETQDRYFRCRLEGDGQSKCSIYTDYPHMDDAELLDVVEADQVIARRIGVTPGYRKDAAKDEIRFASSSANILKRTVRLE